MASVPYYAYLSRNFYILSFKEIVIMVNRYICKTLWYHHVPLKNSSFLVGNHSKLGSGHRASKGAVGSVVASRPATLLMCARITASAGVSQHDSR